MKKKLFFPCTLFFIALLALPAEEIQTVSSFDLEGPVRSVEETVREYSSAGKAWIPGRFRSVSARSFDEKNRLLSETFFNWEGKKSYFSEYEYDSQDNVTRFRYEAYDYLGALSSLTSVENDYYPEGILKKSRMETADGSGKLLENTETIHDSLGNMISQTTETAGGGVIRDWKRSPVPEGGGEEIELTERDDRGRVIFRENTLLNSGGSIIRQSRRTADGTMDEWNFRYGGKGELLEAVWDSSAGDSGKWLFSYDRRGNKTKMVKTDSEGRMLLRRTYQYAGTGSLSSETAEWFEGDDPSFTIRYTYDGRGNVIREEADNIPFHFGMTWSRKYDRQDRMMTESITDTRGNHFSSFSTGYDERDMQTGTLTTTMGIETGYRQENTYDSQGRILLSKTGSAGKSSSSITRYEYDEQGEVTEQAVLNPDGSIISLTAFVYEYDSRGNWISKKTFSTNNQREEYGFPVEERRRVISY